MVSALFSLRAIALLAVAITSAAANPLDLNARQGGSTHPCDIVRCPGETTCTVISNKAVCKPDVKARAAEAEASPAPATEFLAERGVACGTATCDTGKVCCNSSCGICVAPGGSCTQQICEPALATCGKSVCAAGKVCCNSSCGICVAPGGSCTQQICT